MIPWGASGVQAVGESPNLADMPDIDQLTSDLQEFLDTSPTAYHAVDGLANRLLAAGARELVIDEPWPDAPRLGFVRRGGALHAWRLPQAWSRSTGLRVFAAHSDSPALACKPRGDYARSGQLMIDVEVYGAPMLHTWFDRDLAVAGRLVDLTGRCHLVRTYALALVPGLAIHLGRDANNDFQIDRQRDLMATWGLGYDGNLLEFVAAGVGLGFDRVAGQDLLLVSAEPSARLGAHGELLVAARLDDLLGVHAGLTAFLAAPVTQDVQILAIHDHEEVGSQTAAGASGPLAGQVLRRLSAAAGLPPDAHLAWLNRGWQLSADVTHGLHPNQPERHDPIVQPRLGGGPVLKWSAAARYGTDAETMAIWRRACQAAEITDQVFVNNNSVPGGASLGPLAATRLGVRTVDAGVPILGMHSIREQCAPADQAAFIAVGTAFLAGA